MDKRITTDTVMMLRELTAENGAKALLIGEFKELITLPCPKCADDDGIIENCEICKGFGSYEQEVWIDWTTIKEIYAMAVDKLAH